MESGGLRPGVASFAEVLTRSPDVRSQDGDAEALPAPPGPSSSSRTVWGRGTGLPSGMSARDFFADEDMFPVLPFSGSRWHQQQQQQDEEEGSSSRARRPRRRAEVVILSPSPPSDPGPEPSTGVETARRSGSRSSRPYSPPPDLPPTPPPARGELPRDDRGDRPDLVEPDDSASESADEATLFVTSLTTGEASRRRRRQLAGAGGDTASLVPGGPSTAPSLTVRSPLSPSASPPALRPFSDLSPLFNDNAEAEDYPSAFGYRTAPRLPTNPWTSSLMTQTSPFAPSSRTGPFVDESGGVVHVLFCGRAPPASPSTPHLPPGFSYSDPRAAYPSPSRSEDAGCGALLCVRASDQAVKRSLPSDTASRRSQRSAEPHTWSSDAPPVPHAVGMLDYDCRAGGATEFCDCGYEQFGCLNCGQIVGHVTQFGCPECKHQARDGHRFRFHKTRVRAAVRLIPSPYSASDVLARERGTVFVEKKPWLDPATRPDLLSIVPPRSTDDEDKDEGDGEPVPGPSGFWTKRRWRSPARRVMKWKELPSVEDETAAGAALHVDQWDSALFAQVGYPLNYVSPLPPARLSPPPPDRGTSSTGLATSTDPPIHMAAEQRQDSTSRSRSTRPSRLPTPPPVEPYDRQAVSEEFRFGGPNLRRLFDPAPSTSLEGLATRIARGGNEGSSERVGMDMPPWPGMEAATATASTNARSNPDPNANPNGAGGEGDATSPVTVSPRATDGHGPIIQRRQQVSSLSAATVRGGRGAGEGTTARSMARLFGGLSAPPVPVLEAGGDDFESEGGEERDRERGERASSTQPLVRASSLARSPAIRIPPRQQPQLPPFSFVRPPGSASREPDDDASEDAERRSVPGDGQFPTSNARRTSRLFDRRTVDQDDLPFPSLSATTATSGRSGDERQRQTTETRVRTESGSEPRIPAWFGRDSAYVPVPVSARASVATAAAMTEQQRRDFLLSFSRRVEQGAAARRASERERQRDVEDEDAVWADCWPRRQRRRIESGLGFGAWSSEGFDPFDRPFNRAGPVCLR